MPKGKGTYTKRGRPPKRKSGSSKGKKK